MLGSDLDGIGHQLWSRSDGLLIVRLIPLKTIGTSGDRCWGRILSCKEVRIGFEQTNSPGMGKGVALTLGCGRSFLFLW